MYDAIGWSLLYSFDHGPWIATDGRVCGELGVCMVRLRITPAWEFGLKNNMKLLPDLGLEPRS